MEHVVDDEEENDKGLFQTVVDSPKGRSCLMAVAMICLLLISLMSGDIFSFCLVIVAMLATSGFLFFIITRYTTLRLLDVWKDLTGAKRD